MSAQRTKQKKQTISRKHLIALGDDIALAIEKAAWTDELGDKNLYGPTWHMEVAISNWKEATR